MFHLITLILIAFCFGTNHGSKQESFSPEKVMNQIMKIHKVFEGYPISEEPELIEEARSYLDDIRVILEDCGETTSRAIYKKWGLELSFLDDYLEVFGVDPLLPISIETLIQIWQTQREALSDASLKKRKEVLSIMSEIRQAETFVGETKKPKLIKNTVKKVLKNHLTLSKKMPFEGEETFPYAYRLVPRIAQTKLDIDSIRFGIKATLKSLETDPPLIALSQFRNDARQTLQKLRDLKKKLENKEISKKTGKIKMRPIWEEAHNWINYHYYVFICYASDRKSPFMDLFSDTKKNLTLSLFHKGYDMERLGVGWGIDRMDKLANSLFVDYLKHFYWNLNAHIEDDEDLINHQYGLFASEEITDPTLYLNTLEILAARMESMIRAKNATKMIMITKRYISQGITHIRDNLWDYNSMHIYAQRMERVRDHLKNADDVLKAAELMSQASEVGDEPVDYFADKMLRMGHELGRYAAESDMTESALRERLTRSGQLIRVSQQALWQIAHKYHVEYYSEADETFEDSLQKLRYPLKVEFMEISSTVERVMIKLFQKNKELLGGWF